MMKTAGDMEIPAIGLGTWQMQGSEARNAVKFALKHGYRHVDTAAAYDNEVAVGRGIRAAPVDRDEVFLTTKVWHTDLGEQELQAAAQASLDRLNVDYVDLLLVHWPTDDVPLDETMGALEQVREEGLARHIGVSNFPRELLQQARDAADVRCNQVEMHPFFQQQDMVEYCQEHDLVLTAYSPLARGEAVDDPVLQDIAEAHEATAAQVALAWLVQHDPVVAIPKASPKELQQENLEALDLELADDDIERIDGIEQREKMVDPDFAPW